MVYEKSDKKTKKFGKFIALSAIYLASVGSYAANIKPVVTGETNLSVSPKKERGAKTVKQRKSKRDHSTTNN